MKGFTDHLEAVQSYAEELVGYLNRVILEFFALPFPVVAAVQGAVTGGALGLVLASDVVLITPETTITPYYSTVGFSPDGGWTALLPAVIGPKRAAEILYCNRTISASQAVAWGLASRIVDRAALYDEALRVCRIIAEGHPGSQGRTRSLLRPPDLADRLAKEREHFVAQIGEPATQARMLEFLARM